MLIEIDTGDMVDRSEPDEIEWLETDILRRRLVLHSNETGSTIGDVKTLAVKRLKQ